MYRNKLEKVIFNWNKNGRGVKEKLVGAFQGKGSIKANVNYLDERLMTVDIGYKILLMFKS